MIIEPTIKSNFFKNPEIKTLEAIDVKKFEKEKKEEIEKENEKLKKQVENLKLDLKALEKKSKKGGE